MAEFRPVFPAHAIERCGIIITFDSPLPDKALRSIATDLTPELARFGLKPGPPAIGFQIDAATGKVTPIDNPGPMNLVSADNLNQLNLSPNAIAWATQRYVRWEPYKRQFAKVAAPVISAYDQLVSLSSVQVEYWDRFIWSGNWDDFDISKLIDLSNPLVASQAASSPKEWHNHCGWFQEIDDGRRLWNVNVDVVGWTSSTVEAQPSVGIYTLARDQFDRAQDQILAGHQLLDRLDDLHLALKDILKKLISTDMSRKIGLIPGETNGGDV